GTFALVQPEYQIKLCPAADNQLTVEYSWCCEQGDIHNTTVLTEFKCRTGDYDIHYLCKVILFDFHADFASR
ncbi:hypothetical protein D6362_24990, partial [Salmonella enterica subsp. enterica serovar Weltevreden]|nr:hypothetical protein [Salmonella enterica subsp. enterica serovar Weltevreden]